MNRKKIKNHKYRDFGAGMARLFYTTITDVIECHDFSNISQKLS